MDEPFQYPQKQNLRTNTYHTTSKDNTYHTTTTKDNCFDIVSDASFEDLSSDTGCSSEPDDDDDDNDEEEIETIVGTHAHSTVATLNGCEVERMRVALGNSAKRFMESMTSVDEMKKYIVNMAVDIKLNEIDVTHVPHDVTHLPQSSNAAQCHYQHRAKVSEVCFFSMFVMFFFSFFKCFLLCL